MMNQESIEFFINVFAHYALGANVVGLNFIIAAVISAVNRYRPLTKKLLVWGLLSLAASISSSRLITECAKFNAASAAILGLVICLLLTFGYLWALLLPARVAKSRNHAHFKAILILNLLVLIPFAWLAAFWWATIPQKKLVANSSEKFSPEMLAIVDRAGAASAMLEKANFKNASKRLRLAAFEDASEEKIKLRLSETLDRLMFDFELPDGIADELRKLSAQIESGDL